MATGISKTKWNGDYGPSNHPQTGCTGEIVVAYEGKKTEAAILATPPTKDKVLWQPGNGNRPNRLYFSENLPVLAGLLGDDDIRGKVRLVYIDPPFATRMVFQSRSQSDAYRDLLGGALYIEFLRERLVLIRELLADDGSIYVHLDENMAFPIKLVMDEIFGARNYRNWITRKKCNPKNYTRNAYGNVTDFILFYSKTDSYRWNRPLEKWTPERIAKEYEYVDAQTGRLFKKVPIHAPGVRKGATGQPWRGMNPPPGKHWQFTPQRLDEMEARGEIYWSPNGNPRRKVFLDITKGVPVQDLWLDCRDAHNQNIRITGYPTEKNSDILRRIVEASSDSGDLVLDAFAGSGTTLAVASELNRRWIGIDHSLEAVTTILRRFSEGMTLMGDFVTERSGKSTDQAAFQFEGSTSVGEGTISGPYNVINDFKLFASANVPEAQQATVLELAKHLFSANVSRQNRPRQGMPSREAIP